MAKRTDQQELLFRVGKYKRAPTLPQLRSRLGRRLQGDAGVEMEVMAAVKTGLLRVTNGLFYLPEKRR